jgi:hypothetical protein
VTRDPRRLRAARRARGRAAPRVVPHRPGPRRGRRRAVRGRHHRAEDRRRLHLRRDRRLVRDDGHQLRPRRGRARRRPHRPAPELARRQRDGRRGDRQRPPPAPGRRHRVGRRHGRVRGVGDRDGRRRGRDGHRLADDDPRRVGLRVRPREEMRKAAEMLDSTSNAYASAYAAKAGGTAAEWRAVMVEETWYTGEEAVAAKLADRIATDRGQRPRLRRAGRARQLDAELLGHVGLPGVRRPARRDDRALFAYAGRAEAPPPRMPNRPAPRPPPRPLAGPPHPRRTTTCRT